MKITYLVGNGLDLSLGLATSYKNFYEYQKETYKNNREKFVNVIYDDIYDEEKKEFIIPKDAPKEVHEAYKRRKEIWEKYQEY